MEGKLFAFIDGTPRRVVASSIRGIEGNTEFLVHGRVGMRTVDAGTVEAIAFEESKS